MAWAISRPYYGAGVSKGRSGSQPTMSKDRSGFPYGYVRAGGAMAFALVAGLQSPAATAREFRAADIQEENFPTVQALRYLDRLVTERTGGGHRHPGFLIGPLGRENATQHEYLRVRQHL